MEKQFGELSQFLKEKRDVELFRSSDLNNTAIYFTETENKRNEKAFFELLRFGLEGGDHQIYVRFPNTDYFVEMLGGGMGSGRGDMLQDEGKNVWKDKNSAPFSTYSHGKNLLLLFGRNDWTPEFNFMTKVAEYDKGNPFNRPYPQETFVNYEEIEKALSLKFLKLPENVRKIEYLFKTKDSKKYFVIDYPAYNFQYTTQRFRVVENDFVVIEKSKVIEYQIKDFVRYRDGGTTIITITDENGVEHKLFSPQRMFDDGKNLVPKFDETELIEIEKNTDEWNTVVKLIGVELEPIEKDDDNDTNTDIELTELN